MRLAYHAPSEIIIHLCTGPVKGSSAGFTGPLGKSFLYLTGEIERAEDAVPALPGDTAEDEPAKPRALSAVSVCRSVDWPPGAAPMRSGLPAQRTTNALKGPYRRRRTFARLFPLRQVDIPAITGLQEGKDVHGMIVGELDQIPRGLSAVSRAQSMGKVSGTSRPSQPSPAAERECYVNQEEPQSSIIHPKPGSRFGDSSVGRPL